MSDQIKDKALKEEEQTIQTESPEVEEKVAEDVKEPETQVESTEETETEGSETETTETPKKGYTKRVQELANKAKAAEERAESLEERIAELTSSVEPVDDQPYMPQVEPGSEISPEQYASDVTRRADAIVTLKMKQSEAIQRINSESAEAIKTYPELDPDSDSFNKELSESITGAVEAHVKVNPYTASVKKFVEKLMKPYKGAVEKEVGKATENIAKQVSETALRPTSIHKQEKTASDKSIAELEQELGIVQS